MPRTSESVDTDLAVLAINPDSALHDAIAAVDAETP